MSRYVYYLHCDSGIDIRGNVLARNLKTVCLEVWHVSLK